MIRFLLVTGLLVRVLPLTAQTFQELLDKSDSAYLARDYASAAVYAEQSLSLTDDSEEKATVYYNIACNHALSGDTVKALNNLANSWAQCKQVGVTCITAEHLIQDTDLKILWNSSTFHSLIRKFYPADAERIIGSFQPKIWSFADIHASISEAKRNGMNSLTLTNLIIKEDIRFMDELEAQNLSITFNHCQFHGKLRISEGLTLEELKFQNCIFQGLTMIGPTLKFPIKITDCTMLDLFALQPEVKNSSQYWFANGKDNWFNVSHCKFAGHIALTCNSQNPVSLKFDHNSCNTNIEINLILGATDYIQIFENKLPDTNIFIRGTNLRRLDLTNNELLTVGFSRVLINEAVQIEKNKVENMLLQGSVFPELPLNAIQWQDISRRKIGYFKNWGGDLGRESRYLAVNGQHPKDIEEEESFRELMKVYSIFLNTYKINNDLESYNECYIEMKEIQSQRFEFLYKSNNGFQTYFRWKLSQLLRFYVRYGTDPARAIVISVYIILLFGLFFFFFPSDWDVSSKGQLIRNYRDFVEKNEKGYFLPFLTLLLGLLKSLLNAVTLSLNAFVTLGFGNIPTHGIARYFCVLEGFIGWFLLSIFTVALINQVI